MPMSEYLLETLDFEVSNPCNEQCKHCYRIHKNKERGFISPEDVDFVLNEVKTIRSDDMLVLLTGGEFLLNKDWRKIVQIVVNHNCRFAIYTNGSLLTEDDADFIAKYIGRGLKEVQISLYGIAEEIHDAVTGVKGSCKKSKEALLMLKSRGVPVFVSICAMQENKNDFYNVMRWCDKNSINSAAHLMIFGPSDYSDSNKEQRLTRDDLENFFNISMENDGELSYIWGNPKAKAKELVSNEFYYFNARELCISADGTIYPEVGWYEKLGNIHTDKIESIFKNSPFLNKMRSYRISEMQCATCDAFEYCTRYPLPHLNSNNGQLGKYDKRSCDFIHILKEFSERRDLILSQRKKN